MKKRSFNLNTTAKKYPFAFCLCFTALLTAIQFLILHLIVPVLLFGDDLLVEIALSGEYSGAQPDIYPFINMLLINGLKVLYRLNPVVPWYSILLEGTLILSCFAFQLSILMVCRKKQIPLWLAEVVYLIFFYICVLYVTMPVSFTYVASISGAAAVAVLLSGAFCDEHKKLHYLFSIVLLFLAFLIRPESGLVDLCFWLLSGVFIVLFQINANKETSNPSRSATVSLLLFLLVAIIGCGAFMISDKMFRGTPEGQQIEEWNDVRSSLIDYHKTSYSTDSAFYDSIGWNEEFYALEDSWYLLDDNCDYEHYYLIDQYTIAETPKQTLLDVANSTLKTVLQFFSSIFFSPLLVFFCGVLLLAVWSSIRHWHQGGYLFLAFQICALGGTILMWFYLSYIGRLTGHVFRICCIPAICCMLLSALFLHGEDGFQNSSCNPRIGWLFFILLFFLLPLSLFAGTKKANILIAVITLVGGALSVVSVMYVLHEKRLLARLVIAVACFGLFACAVLTTRDLATDVSAFLTRQEKYKAEQQYVSSHPDEILISAREYTPVRIDYIHAFSQDKTNLFYSVDFLLYSDSYEEKLQRNHVDSVTVSSYFDDNVYYIGDSENDETLQLLLDYMYTQYGDGVTAEVHEELEDGISVYQFKK